MKKVIFAILAVTASVLSYASGSGGGSSVQAVPKPVVFRVLNGAEPATLDPSLCEDTASHNILLALFEGLLTYDPETNDGIPGIAESWSVSADGTVYTFELRKSTWSDGVPITAQGFVDSWLRTLNPETASPYAWMIAMVVEGAASYLSGETGPEAVWIRALDDYIFEVTMVGPVPYVTSMLPHNVFAVLPLHVIEKHGESWTLPGNMVSNGAYILEQWRPQEMLSVVRNPRYWDAETVSVDRIIYFPSEDDIVRLNMYLAGEADWLKGGVPPGQLQSMKVRHDFQTTPELATIFYDFNHSIAPLNDVRVRKALAMAFDKQRFIEHVAQGVHTPTDTMVPPMKGYEPVRGNHYEVESARKLLAEAGFPGGKDFPKLTILYSTSKIIQVIAEYVQQQWQQNINIEVQIENAEWKTVLARASTQDFELLHRGWVGDYLDANTFLEVFQSDSDMNRGRYSNPRFDRLLQEAARLPAGSGRAEILRQAEDILIRQDQAVIPILHLTSINMIDTDKWGGWTPTILNCHPPKYIYKK
ncbi:MAG: peptide ABC transporter substrate-binding protein [Spirochaetaceae bacterium]|nr:MAG: peptide ABC transporter substrate-binding protein [Spirochaetaceae bacterium]